MVKKLAVIALIPVLYLGYAYADSANDEDMFTSVYLATYYQGVQGAIGIQNVERINETWEYLMPLGEAWVR